MKRAQRLNQEALIRLPLTLCFDTFVFLVALYRLCASYKGSILLGPHKNRRQQRHKRGLSWCEPKWVSFGFQVKKTPNAFHYNVCEPLKRRMDWDSHLINLLKWIQFFLVYQERPCVSSKVTIL